MTDAQVEAAADRIVREVAELPDRTSPDDWPEAMLVTADELRAIVGAATAAAQAGAPSPESPRTEYERSLLEFGWQQGFAAGIEAAEGAVASLPWLGEYKKQIIRETIRALRPPAPAESDGGSLVIRHALTIMRLTVACRDAIEAIERGSSTAPIAETLRAALSASEPAEREPTEIKDFPGRAVDTHLKATGRLPNETDDALCQCPRCGRMHKDMGFGPPPLSASESAGAQPLCGCGQPMDHKEPCLFRQPMLPPSAHSGELTKDQVAYLHEQATNIRRDWASEPAGAPSKEETP